MERRDEQGGVRPLEPEGAPTPARPTRKRPGLAIAATFVVLLVVLVVFGAGGDQQEPDEPEPALVASESEELAITTTTLPPPLGDLLPIEFDRLIALSRSDDPRTVLWPSVERFARSYRLPSAPVSAQFDNSGEAIAFIDPSWNLFAGPLPGDAAIQIESMASAAVFHPIEDATLAYTAAPTGAGSNALFRVHVQPGLLGGTESTLVTPLADGQRLLTWGDWGYAIAVDEPAAIVVLDPIGRPLRVMGGVAYAAGGDALLVDATQVAAADDLALLAPTVVAAAPTIGVVDRYFKPVFLFPGPNTGIPAVKISADGSLIAATTYTNTGGTSLTIRDQTDATLRTVRVDSIVYLIGFVSRGTHLAMQDSESGELVIIDWRTGAHHRIPGVTGEFVAVHL
ncbi:MAG: hypothetical protein WCC01_08140 [Acidimicrobiia bacterium]